MGSPAKTDESQLNPQVTKVPRPAFFSGDIVRYGPVGDRREWMVLFTRWDHSYNREILELIEPPHGLALGVQRKRSSACAHEVKLVLCTVDHHIPDETHDACSRCKTVGQAIHVIQGSRMRWRASLAIALERCAEAFRVVGELVAETTCIAYALWLTDEQLLRRVDEVSDSLIELEPNVEYFDASHHETILHRAWERDELGKRSEYWSRALKALQALTLERLLRQQGVTPSATPARARGFEEPAIDTARWKRETELAEKIAFQQKQRDDESLAFLRAAASNDEPVGPVCDPYTTYICHPSQHIKVKL